MRKDIICQFIDELISFPDRYILQTFIQLNVYIICKAVNSKFLEFLIIIRGNNNSLHCIVYRYVWEKKKKQIYIFKMYKSPQESETSVSFDLRESNTHTYQKSLEQICKLRVRTSHFLLVIPQRRHVQTNYTRPEISP